MKVKDLIKKYNPFNPPNKDSKIILYEGKHDIEIEYISPKDLDNFSRKLNKTGIALLYGSGKIFAFVHNILKPVKLETEVESIFSKEEEKYISEGTYGKVSSIPEGIVKKETINDEGLTKDIIMEIGIYTMFKNLLCLPEMHGFELGKTQKLYLTKGKNSLNKIYKSFSPEEKIKIMFRLCKCMRSIAGQGVMHLDLKPQNIIVDINDKVQIIDWGLAEIDTRRRDFREKNLRKQTLWYRSPEILAKDYKYSIPVDIYSMGLIFLEMFIDNPPFQAHSEKEYMIHTLRLAGFSRFVYRYESDEKNIIPTEDGEKNIIPTEDGKDIDIYIRYEEVFNDTNFSTKSFTMEKISQKFKIKDPIILDFLAGMLEFKPEFRSKWNDIIIHPIFQTIKRESIPRYNMLINNMPIIPSINAVWNKNRKINSKMRKILFEWLDEVKTELSLSKEALELCFQLVDLYIVMNGSVHKHTIQLLGCVCMIIGSSIYHDLDIQELINNMAYFSNDTYTKEQIDNWLNNIIIFLKGNIIIPTYTSYSYFVEKEPVNSLSNYLRDDIYSKPFLTQITGEKVKNLDMVKI